MSLRQRTFSPGNSRTCTLQPVLDRAHDKVRRVQRNLTRTLTLDLHDEAGFGGLHDDLVVQAQREAQAVEPWTQVRAGRRNDGGGRQSGRQSLRHDEATR